MGDNSSVQIRLVSPVDKGEVSRLISIVTAEFASSPKYHEHLQKGIEHNIDSGKSLIFQMSHEGQSIGLAILNIYDWSEIYKQLYLVPIETTAPFKQIKLTSFEQLVQSNNLTPRQTVFEYAYFTILPEFRGKGHLSSLWDFAGRYLRENWSSYLELVLIKKANKVVIDKELVHEFMFLHEREAQKTQQGQYTTVQGIPVDTERLAEYLQTPFDLTYDSGVHAMTHTVKKHDFVPVGFSKSLCPTWIKVI